VTGGAGIGFEGSGRGGNVANGGDGGNSRKGDGGNGGAGGITKRSDSIFSLLARKFSIISGGPAISFDGNSHGGDVGDAGNGGNGGSSGGSGGSSVINGKN
ncbi:hypothetical protein COCC4DRAFT_46041, partial [Bipolaris maydis ATCC 48331]